MENESYFEDADFAQPVPCSVCDGKAADEDVKRCVTCQGWVCEGCVSECCDCEEYLCADCATYVGTDQRGRREYRCEECVKAYKLAEVVRQVEEIPATVTPQQSEELWTTIAGQLREVLTERLTVPPSGAVPATAPAFSGGAE